MVRVALKAASKTKLKIKKTYVWISCEMYTPMYWIYNLMENLLVNQAPSRKKPYQYYLRSNYLRALELGL